MGGHQIFYKIINKTLLLQIIIEYRLWQDTRDMPKYYYMREYVVEHYVMP